MTKHKYQPSDQWLKSRRREFKTFDESHNRYIAQSTETKEVEGDSYFTKQPKNDINHEHYENVNDLTSKQDSYSYKQEFTKRSKLCREDYSKYLEVYSQIECDYSTNSDFTNVNDLTTFEHIDHSSEQNDHSSEQNDHSSEHIECPVCEDFLVNGHCECCGYDQKLDQETQKFKIGKPNLEILGSSFDPQGNLIVLAERSLKRSKILGIYHKDKLLTIAYTYDQAIKKFREIERGVETDTTLNNFYQVVTEHQKAYQEFTAQYPKYQVLRITYIKSLEKWLLLIEDKSSRKQSQNSYGVLWWHQKNITIITTGNISHCTNHYFKLETLTRDIDILNVNQLLTPDLSPYRNDNRTYLRSGSGRLCEQYRLNFEEENDKKKP
jgi:hypothetical protein